MALAFPSTPTVGDIHTAGALSWRWDGVKWVSDGGASSGGGGGCARSGYASGKGSNGVVELWLYEELK